MHLFLAPHYDDVALSCGATVAVLADAGARPLVVTVFGGEPDDTDLTAFARWQHERWGTGATDTIATRLAEDRAAAAILGCQTAVFPFRDAIYRGDGYLSDEALFGPVLAADAALPAQIVAALTPMLHDADQAQSTIMVPLGVGNHVDHQLVYRAGQLLATAGWSVWAYADFPYAILGSALADRLAVVAAEVGPPRQQVVSDTLQRRIAAIGAYQTQLPVIFRFTTDWQATVTASVGGSGQPAVETFWPLLPGR